VSKHRELAIPPREELLPPAQEDLDGLIGHFEELLRPRAITFRRPRGSDQADPAQHAHQAGLEPSEVRTLRGVLTPFPHARAD